MYLDFWANGSTIKDGLEFTPTLVYIVGRQTNSVTSSKTYRRIHDVNTIDTIALLMVYEVLT